MEEVQKAMLHALRVYLFRPNFSALVVLYEERNAPDSEGAALQNPGPHLTFLQHRQILIYMQARRYRTGSGKAWKGSKLGCEETGLTLCSLLPTAAADTWDSNISRRISRNKHDALQIMQLLDSQRQHQMSQARGQLRPILCSHQN